MTDLELCKKIAEIEFPNVIYGKQIRDSELYVIHNQANLQWFLYNPLTDKALLWDLMVKYRVIVDTYSKYCYQYNSDGDKVNFVYFKTKDDLPRAILECIVESKEK